MPPSPRNPRLFRRLLGAFLACFVLAGAAVSFVGPAAAEPRKQTEQHLKEYQRKLKAAQAEATQLGNQISKTKQALDAIRGDVAGLKGEIQLAQKEYKKLEAELEATQLEQDSTQGDLDNVRGDMELRARSAFIAGPTGGLEVILGSQSFQDMAERSTFLNALQAQDANTASSIQSIAAKLHDLAVQQREKAREAERALRYLQQQQDALAKKRDEEASTLAELNKDLHAARVLEKKWAHKVNVTIKKLGYAVGGDGPFYSCPVPNYHWIADDFGAPRYGGGFHYHQGNDIGAAAGADIVAPFDGVAKTSSNSLGGNAVNVYGKDGYVYNAHLSAFEGSFPRHVNAGEVVGHVGMTGDAQGTVNHDHFEWHPNNGDAVDPHDFLMEVCHR